MPKTKISEFSATPANNTDIDSINIAEGCAPSGINDAIRELMAQLKDFQTGAVGDSFNGPVGATTAGTGAFTTLSASSTATLSGLTASTALALDASKNIVSVTNTGTGSNVLATSPTLVTPILGTPTSATLTNATGLPIGTGVSGLGSGVATFLATPTSANLLAAVTNETGTGSLVFATSPTLVTPVLGVATGTSFQGIIGNVTPAAGTFTTITGSNDASVNGLTVGRGGGAVSSNTAVGASALAANSAGTRITAVGYRSMVGATGNFNAAFGSNTFESLTSGTNGTAIGDFALQQTTGSFNTAIGNGSGYLITTGAKNTIVGIYSGNQDGLDIRTASNYAIISDGDGNRLLSTANGYSLALDGGAVPVTGTGITFPATQSASTDANTLDDYEEGTFTATANPASGSITFVAGVNGSYRKIGGCVTCLINLEVSAVSSPSGRLRIESLPFTAISQPSVFFMALTAGNSGYGDVIRGDIQVSATNIFADRIIDSVQTLDVAGACKVGTFISASFSYFVA